MENITTPQFLQAPETVRAQMALIILKINYIVTSF